MRKLRSIVFFLALSAFALTTKANSCSTGVDKPELDIYKSCESQMQKVEKALCFWEQKKDKPFIVYKIGHNSCPWCQSLHKIFQNKEFLNSVSGNFEIVELSVYRDGDPNTNVTSYLKQLLNTDDDGLREKIKGFPFLLVYDHKDEGFVPINTASLELNTSSSKGHSEDKVRKALEDAFTKLSKNENPKVSTWSTEDLLIPFKLAKCVL